MSESKLVAVVDWVIPSDSDKGMMMVATAIDKEKLKQDAMFFTMDDFNDGVKTLKPRHVAYKEQDLIKEHIKFFKRSINQCTFD